MCTAIHINPQSAGVQIRVFTARYPGDAERRADAQRWGMSDPKSEGKSIRSSAIEQRESSMDLNCW